MADRNNYTYISTNTTTQILDKIGNGAKTANEGILHTLIVGGPGASGGTITIYDGPDASSEVVMVMNVPTGTWPFSIQLDVALNYGLTVVTAVMTTPDVTLTWR